MTSLLRLYQRKWTRKHQNKRSRSFFFEIVNENVWMCTYENGKKIPFKIIDTDWQYWFLNYLKTPHLKDPWEIYLEEEEKDKFRIESEKAIIREQLRDEVKEAIEGHFGVVHVTF